MGRTRRQLASELITEVAVIDKKIKAANAQLAELVESAGSTLQQLNGIGPSGAARLLGDIGDVSRFASRDHFASWNGTAPIDASSGDQRRHRLSRAGNRRINRVLHIMAIVQLRNDTEGRAYYRRKLGRGQEPDGSHPRPETPTVQCGIPADAPRRETRQDGPGRASGSNSTIQRGRLNPDSRHFGEATSRTRHNPR
ncbi:transposase [Dactylosporangium sp. McL0621]|uniref:transposase n=1 Tax=Dactylosporangium sp. McL0621 TaxID=3415678 RepID=UPI003CEFAECB